MCKNKIIITKNSLEYIDSVELLLLDVENSTWLADLKQWFEQITKGSSSFLNMKIIKFFYDSYLKYLSIDGKDTKDNLYNYSLYRTFMLYKDLELVKNNEVEKQIERVSKLAKIYKGYIKVEQTLIKKVSRISNMLFKNKDKFYIYITEGDGDVRKTHRDMDNKVFRASDSAFKSATRLLSDWNCRCDIDLADKDDIETYKPKQLPKFTEKDFSDGNYSDIDIEESRVIIFTEESFDDVPELLRKSYRKNGF